MVTRNNSFDSLFRESFECSVFGTLDSGTYPPYNLSSQGNISKLEMAVAGFKKSEITIEQGDRSLTIKGEKSKGKELGGTVVHNRGIAQRSFMLKFPTSADAEVSSAKLEDGILTVIVSRPDKELDQRKLISIS